MTSHIPNGGIKIRYTKYSNHVEYFCKTYHGRSTAATIPSACDKSIHMSINNELPTTSTISSNSPPTNELTTPPTDQSHPILNVLKSTKTKNPLCLTG